MTWCNFYFTNKSRYRVKYLWHRGNEWSRANPAPPIPEIDFPNDGKSYDNLDAIGCPGTGEVNHWGDIPLAVLLPLNTRIGWLYFRVENGKSVPDYFCIFATIRDPGYIGSYGMTWLDGMGNGQPGNVDNPLPLEMGKSTWTSGVNNGGSPKIDCEYYGSPAELPDFNIDFGMTYQLINEANNEAMDLIDGNWSQGSVQTLPRASSNLGANINATRNQRWLVSLLPGSRACSIINLFYGVSMGISDPGYCFASPCSIGANRFQWRIKDDGNGRWVLAWARDQRRVLCILPNASNTRLFVDTKQDMDIYARRQCWLPQYDTDLIRQGDDMPKWMSFVPDNTKLSMLNIPSTHQSLALHGAQAQGGDSNQTGLELWDNPRCQNRSPYEQLLFGVRSLDLRFDLWTSHDRNEPDCLFARHGNAVQGFFGVNEGYSLLSVLLTLVDFLKRFPMETVIINIRNEADTTGGFYQGFWTDFKSIPERYIFKWYKAADGSDPDMSTLDLGSVRGQIIIVSSQLKGGSNNLLPSGASFVYFNNEAFVCNSSRFNRCSNEYAYDLPKSQWDLKLKNCAANISKAMNDRRTEWVYITSWNMSQGDPIKAVTHGLYNPIDYAWYAYNTGPRNIGQVLHPNTLGLGTNETWKRIGVVSFDFCEIFDGVIADVVRSNRGCGGLRSVKERLMLLPQPSEWSEQQALVSQQSERSSQQALLRGKNECLPDDATRERSLLLSQQQSECSEQQTLLGGKNEFLANDATRELLQRYLFRLMFDEGETSDETRKLLQRWLFRLVFGEEERWRWLV